MSRRTVMLDDQDLALQGYRSNTYRFDWSGFATPLEDRWCDTEGGCGGHLYPIRWSYRNNPERGPANYAGCPACCRVYQLDRPLGGAIYPRSMWEEYAQYV